MADEGKAFIRRKIGQQRAEDLDMCRRDERVAQRGVDDQADTTIPGGTIAVKGQRMAEEIEGVGDNPKQASQRGWVAAGKILGNSFPGTREAATLPQA